MHCVCKNVTRYSLPKTSHFIQSLQRNNLNARIKIFLCVFILHLHSKPLFGWKIEVNEIFFPRFSFYGFLAIVTFLPFIFTLCEFCDCCFWFSLQNQKMEFWMSAQILECSLVYYCITSNIIPLLRLCLFVAEDAKLSSVFFGRI